jgi:hypothetical protein
MNNLLGKLQPGLSACKAMVCLVPLLSGLAMGQSLSHGVVEGNTYTDKRFGLRYTFPRSLEVQSSVNGMSVGTGEKQGVSEFLFSALERPNGQVRSGVFITADPKGALRATDVPQFLRSMITTVMVLQDHPTIRPVTIAGRQFYRADAGGQKPVPFYGIQLATTCNAQFLAFWFSAATPEKMVDLIHSLDGLQLNCPANAQ